MECDKCKRTRVSGVCIVGVSSRRVKMDWVEEGRLYCGCGLLFVLFGLWVQCANDAVSRLSDWHVVLVGCRLGIVYGLRIRF